MNVLVISGTILSSPTISSSSTGTNYTRFAVSVFSFNKNSAGYNSYVMDCIAFSELAEKITTNMPKGTKVLIKGILECREVNNPETNKIERKYYVVCQSSEVMSKNLQSTDYNQKQQTTNEEEIFNDESFVEYPFGKGE